VINTCWDPLDLPHSQASCLTVSKSINTSDLIHMATKHQLWEAARVVIASLQGIPELHKAKVTIIGGVALQNHIPDRATRVSWYSCL
jgi:hypothetical protein